MLLNTDFVNACLIIGGILLLVSIMGSKLSVRIGVPTLIFFILVGIIARKMLNIDAEGGDWDKTLQVLAKVVGVIALTFILFSGGLETEKAHIYPIWRSGLLLSTIGALITALVVGLFLYIIPANHLDLTLAQGVLVGAIVASTDAAVVFSILRSRKINLKAHMGPLLELESGSNDVMVCFLMNFLLRLINNKDETSLLFALPAFFLEIGIGAIGGVLTGYGMLWIINKINLPQQGLYAPLTLAMIFLPCGLVNVLHGSGYLTVYIAGIILGNRDFIHRKTITKFYEGLGWLLQIAMFIALGLLVKLGLLLKIAFVGLMLSVLLMFFARPLSVFISLCLSSFTKKQKVFISWVGLRGAVPIVFATYLYGSKELVGLKLADPLFHLIFFVVLVSILVQGSTLYPLAKKLKLEIKNPVDSRRKKLEIEVDEETKKMLIQVEIPVGSPVQEKPIVDIGLPKEAIIALIGRGQEYLLARGSTVLQVHDKLFFVINTKKELKEIHLCLGITN